METRTFELKRACEVILSLRGKSILVTTMSAMKAVDAIAPEASMTLASVPLMGGCAGLGLGLALGQDTHPVVALDGDASLLMELGVLSTVANARPARFVHVVFDNGVQFNGNWPLPLPANSFDFAAAAMAAGYRGARKVTNEVELEAAWAQASHEGGAWLLHVIVKPDPPALGPGRPGPEQADWRFERLRKDSRRLMAQLRE